MLFAANTNHTGEPVGGLEGPRVSSDRSSCEWCISFPIQVMPSLFQNPGHLRLFLSKIQQRPLSPPCTHPAGAGVLSGTLQSLSWESLPATQVQPLGPTSDMPQPDPSIAPDSTQPKGLRWASRLLSPPSQLLARGLAHSRRLINLWNKHINKSTRFKVKKFTLSTI